jgi:ubiquinone biosynthesis protein COQ9
MSEVYNRLDDRERLVEAILPHVPFDGWSEIAFKAGADDVGIELPRALNAFPGGMAEVLAFNHQQADARMVAALVRDEASNLKIRDRIARAVQMRLVLVDGQREAIRAGLSFLLLPENAPLGPKLLYGTVDAIWHAIGDRSTDFSFYTKRALLAAVYSTTLLYWLNDKSEGHAASWAFLERRIADVMKIPQATGQIRAIVERLPNPLGLLARGGQRPGAPFSMPRRRRLARR